MATIIEVSGPAMCGKTTIAAKIHLMLSNDGYKSLSVLDGISDAALKVLSKSNDVIIIDKDIK